MDWLLGQNAFLKTLNQNCCPRPNVLVERHTVVVGSDKAHVAQKIFSIGKHSTFHRLLLLVT